MTRRRRVVLALLALGLVIALVFAWRARTPAPVAASAARAPAEAVPVVLGSVTDGLDNVQVEATGTGLARHAVTLYPAVAGEVAQVLFRAGQRVGAGQVLLRLTDRPQQLAVDLAAARLEAAQRLLARYEATRGTGAVPGSVVDEARSTVRLAEIEVRQAREALADRTLRAPFAGVVGLPEVEPGDRVTPETVIATLDDRRVLEVAFQVPERFAGRLRVGQALTVANPAWPGRRFAGRIAQIDSRVEAASRDLRLRGAVPNAEDLLRPGMSFQVQLTLAGEPYPAVPSLALQWGREGAFVWVVRAGRAQQVAVRPVRREEERVLVQGPLQAGELVVVEGVQRLRPGRAVTAMDPQNPLDARRGQLPGTTGDDRAAGAARQQGAAARDAADAQTPASAASAARPQPAASAASAPASAAASAPAMAASAARPAASRSAATPAPGPLR